MDRMIKLSELNLVSPDALKLIMKKFIEIYQLGSTSEFMEAMDKPQESATDLDMQKMKIAMAEVIQDIGLTGPKASEDHITESKIGTIEALKDADMLDKKEEVTQKEPSKSISFKDLPAEGKAQLAQQAGIQLSPDVIEQDQKEKLQVKTQNATK